MGNDQEKHVKNRFHRKSYFGPILLITIGLVFLAKNLGIIPGEGWGTVWRLWPLLLIIGGLDDLFRREGVAWPVLMIGAGFILLLNYFGPRSMISWTQIIQLWPILIIAVGIDVIFKGQTGWKSLLGVALSIILIGAAVFLAFQGVQVQAEYLNISEDYSPDVKNAALDLSLDVGVLVVEPGSRAGRLISGSVTPRTVADDLDEVQGRQIYELSSTQPALFPYTGRWELMITPDLSLDLQIATSVGEMLLDLDGLELDSLQVNQGVGRMFLSLPEEASGELLIKQGVGVIEIEIPEDIRIAVDAQNGLSRVRFPADFELDEGYFASPGANSRNADLLIVVEQGVGLVSFEYMQ